jgi:hypothetical protein
MILILALSSFVCLATSDASNDQASSQRGAEEREMLSKADSLLQQGDLEGAINSVWAPPQPKIVSFYLKERGEGERPSLQIGDQRAD